MVGGRVVMFLVNFVLLFSSVAIAQVPVIDAEQVKSWLDGKRKVALIDTRTPEEYREAHIPGAICVPAEQMQLEAARLPKGKNTPIIFYCRGAG